MTFSIPQILKSLILEANPVISDDRLQELVAKYTEIAQSRTGV